MPETVEQKMTKALAVWAKRKRIRAVDFEDAMGWSYSYAWGVLNGKTLFTRAAYGQFIHAYGMDELQELFRIAGLDPQKAQEEN